MNFNQRIIALVDMDCFYCQVEARLNPSLQGKPLAVVQYDQWKGGGIIAVNYEAKSMGVTRGMRGEQARQKCPDLQLASVPMLRGKADLSKYREAGEQVAQVFVDFSNVVQRASIDEAYIDLTVAVQERIKKGINSFSESCLNSTFIVGFSDLKSNKAEDRQNGLKEWLKFISETSPDSSEFQLTVGAMVVEEMRAEVLARTGFHCSAGIAHNKILAKLVAGLHKPKHQTVLPQDGIPELYQSLPVYKIKNLGGKFGEMVSGKLQVAHMSDLYKYSLAELQHKFDEKSGKWLYDIARGIDNEPVTPRLMPESIGCCKNFRGKNKLSTKEEVRHWIEELADEISDRLKKDLEKHKRRARNITVSFIQETHSSRSHALPSYEKSAIANCAYELLKKFNAAPPSSDEWIPPITFLGLSVGKFAKELGHIDAFLRSKSTQKSSAGPSKEVTQSCDKILVTQKENAKVSSIQKEKTKESKPEPRSFFLSYLSKLNSGPSKTEEKEEAPTSPPQSNQEDYETTEKICEECKKSVKLIDFFEHLDFHVAMKLQSELNRVEPQPAPIVPDRHVTGKRKRASTKSEAKKPKDMKYFFQVVSKNV